MGCLSCSELEAKICELAEELAQASCVQTIKDDDTTMDNKPVLEAKREALRTYRELYRDKKCADSDMSDFGEAIATGCSTQTKCGGTSCGYGARSRRGDRSYRK